MITHIPKLNWKLFTFSLQRNRLTINGCTPISSLFPIEMRYSLQLTLIKQIQSSPLKLEILHRWEKDAFLNFEQAEEKLSQCREISVDHDDASNLYIDLGVGNLRWTSFNLIL